MQETQVVNIHNSSYDVLIDRQTIFGNPFKESQYGREGCIKKFEAYFWRRIEVDPKWKAKVLELKGKTLGCHCKPLPCHGDIYADYLNTFDERERYLLTPQLQRLLDNLDSLATDDGWFEPELQGEAVRQISQMDSPAMQRIIVEAESNPELDAIEAINQYLREAKTADGP